MIYPITNASEFSSLCLNAWHDNASFWDKTRTINQEVKDFIVSEILNTGNTNINAVDIGCGNGWLWEELSKIKSIGKYLGLDYNDLFIDKLKCTQPAADWQCLDFTQPINEILTGKFNVAVSCLSIIEMPKLEVAFDNFNNILTDNGKLILITLDPYFEMVRLNSNYTNLEKDFLDFRKSQSSKYYRKEILLEGMGTGRFYYGVLHTLTYLQKIITSNNFSISKFNELNFTDGSIAKPIYHAYVLTKSGDKN